MISKFGIIMKKIREKENDSLRQMAVKLGISAAFLSAMEVGRKTIPSNYIEKINAIYHLSNDELAQLEMSIYETNKKVSLELEKMNEAQKDVSLLFARKIKTADNDLLKKLKEALLNEEN